MMSSLPFQLQRRQRRQGGVHHGLDRIRAVVCVAGLLLALSSSSSSSLPSLLSSSCTGSSNHHVADAFTSLSRLSPPASFVRTSTSTTTTIGVVKARRQLPSSSSSSLYSTPVFPGGGGAESFSNNNQNNATTFSAVAVADAEVLVVATTTATTDDDDVDDDDTRQHRRAFAIPSTEAGRITEEALRATETAVVPRRSLIATITSADVVGPIVSVVGVIGFLLYTLSESGGLGTQFQQMDLSHQITVLSKVSWFPGTASEAQVVVACVMAFSAFAQALTGFGFAVVAVGALSSMPWLLHSELYEVVTPVAATLGALVGFILLIPYAFIADDEKTDTNPGLDWEEILALLLPCTLLTPIGVELHDRIDPVLGTRLLATLIMGFVSYKLYPMIQEAMINDSGSDGDDATKEEEEAQDLASLSSSLSALEVVGTTTTSSLSTQVSEDTDDDDENGDGGFIQSRMGAILFGSLAGIFGGAFDVQGPPLCVYGDAKGWTPAQFRNNILTVVALNSAFVVAIAEYKGGLNSFYYSYFCLTSLPGVLLGVVAGQYASKRIDPVLFKNLVLIMCLGLGIQLLTVS